MTYDEAVAQLYRVPFNDFVSERKRLAGELKAQGDKEGATRLGKLARPPVSAWAVNQLWWQKRAGFDQLLEVAARVKLGDRDAGKEHRQLLSELREAAGELLRAGGNAATETTLRRVATTLSAIAASGGFAPEPEGALSSDRDPPGFETFTGEGTAPAAAAPARNDAELKRAEVERKRAEEEERQRRLAERERLSAALREARELLSSREREASRLRAELEAAEQRTRETRALLADIETKLGAL
ncbi:MAG TPA: hypothetical protein VHB79_29950 [Polyangiaceae bacterium]|nr:hypothetical protein [Polyangiaceae bacterium]